MVLTNKKEVLKEIIEHADEFFVNLHDLAVSAKVAVVLEHV